jgi:phage terminase large subunit-like protein
MNPLSNLSDIDISRLTKAELVELVQVAEELNRRSRMRRIDYFYPDEGELRRELYVKHLEFFKAGASYRERCIIAANRIGKSESIGAYEMSVHLTGEYPHWWEGRRFDRAVSCWAAGDTGKTVRDILQLKLLGKVGDFGTGMIPGEYLLSTTTKYGLPDAVESAKVKHVSGGTSVVTLKSYDQRRESFQGTEQDVIWLDEEPPQDIYVECLMRTMTTGGMIMCTFTPLMGVSEVVKSFMPGIGFSEGVH